MKRIIYSLFLITCLSLIWGCNLLQKTKDNPYLLHGRETTNMEYNDSSKKIFSTWSEYSSCDYYILDKDSIKINDLDSLLYDCSVNYYKKERIQNNIIDIKMRTFLDNGIVEISETWNNNILCKDFWLSNIQKQYFWYWITWDNSDFKEFLLKHKIYDKKLLTQAIYEYKSSEIQEIDSQSKFAYGDNERHYYLWWFIFYDKKRDNENIKRVLLIDDNYYSRNYNLYDDKYNFIASEWLVLWLKDDILYLSRNVVNNSEENLKKAIETCKINLKKAPLK